MKRIVFGLAIVGLWIALLPAIVNASEVNRSVVLTELTQDSDLAGLTAELGRLPLATASNTIQLVDHCYRGGYGGYGYHDYGYRSYRPSYNYVPRRSYYHHHHIAPRPRSSYYRGGYGYPRSGFGLYIGF